MVVRPGAAAFQRSSAAPPRSRRAASAFLKRSPFTLGRPGGRSCKPVPEVKVSVITCCAQRSRLDEYDHFADMLQTKWREPWRSDSSTRGRRRSCGAVVQPSQAASSPNSRRPEVALAGLSMFFGRLPTVDGNYCGGMSVDCFDFEGLLRT